MLSVVAVAAAAGVYVARHDAHAPRGIRLAEGGAKTGVEVDPGVVGIASIGYVTSTEPMTVLDVVPRHVDAGIEVLAVRAVASGRGVTATGYTRSPSSPGVICWRSWPVDGYGRSYPVAGMRLAAGDTTEFIVYARASVRGNVSVNGFRMTYRTADGHKHVVTDDLSTLWFWTDPQSPPPEQNRGLPCDPDVQDGWTKRVPGFPA